MTDLITENALVRTIVAQSPIRLATVSLSAKRAGLLIVDEVHGFCTVGAGPLAPAAPNAQVDRMVVETDALARRIPLRLAFRDSHTPGQVEAPYPPHCEQGTGHDELVDALKWLETERAPQTFVMPKNCINGVVGGMREDGGNTVFDWIKASSIEQLFVVGICTDICVLTAVTTLLSARTRGFLGNLQDIVVYEPGCATYDLPLSVAESLGLPATAAHPQALYHVMGLLTMQNQGAVIADCVAD